MEQIKLGLKNKINVEYYLNPGIEWEEMRRMRLELESDE